MKPRALAFASLLVGVVVFLLLPSARLRAAAVPSLQPAKTQTLWRELVARPRARTFDATPDCRPLRAVFYAPSDWLRLTTKLAANASPCAEYYISIPPLAADKTRFRTDQAWRIRALGPTFHALAEVHVGGWRAWVNSTGSTWYQAGVEARRRMAVAGYDVSAGDGWIVNEFSSAVRRGLGVARAEAREFVHGLYDGDGGPATQGGVFDIGIGQGGSGPGATDLPLYKDQVEGWLQDGAFWSDMSTYVSDWSQEQYGDPRNYAVAGAPLPTRRDHLNDYFQHQLVHVRLGGEATAAARSFLESAYSPLANAAWQWDAGFPWTMLPVEQMEDYVSGQVYALRHFSALDGQARDHWGFAWAPHNASGMPPADFAAATGALIDRLAAAIHDSGEPLDPSDPGVGACGPPGQNLWCSLELPGAWLNDGWRTFTYWGRLMLAFASPAQELTAGSASGPITIETRLRGSAYDTPSALTVSLASSSAQGRFSTSPSGPWASTLSVTIPAGAVTAPGIYYRDTTAADPVLTASAFGTDSGAQTETVDPGRATAVAVSPPSSSLTAGGSQRFAASAVDAYGNSVSPAGAIWSVTPSSLGTVSPSSGRLTVFTAGLTAGGGNVRATVGGVSGSASIEVVLPAASPPPPPPPPPAPPPPPPPPPPSPVPNQQPTIASARFSEVRRAPGGRRYVIESIRFRACDDSHGRLRARVEQTLRQGKRVRAKGALTRVLASTNGGCGTYKILWRPTDAYLGRGRYTVKLRLRDSEGAWSEPIQHSRVRAHALRGR